MRYWFLLAVVIVLTACNSESVEQEEATVSPREQTVEENYYLPMILDQHVLFSAEDLPADTKEIALSYEVWENGSIVDDLTRSIAIGFSEDGRLGKHEDVLIAFNDLETGIEREIELMIRTMDEEKKSEERINEQSHLQAQKKDLELPLQKKLPLESVVRYL